MKTSYFARLKEIKYPVSICGKAPEFYKGPQFKTLAPKYWFFKEFKDKTSEHYMDEEWYIENYYHEVLEKLDPQEIWDRIKSFYPEAPEDEITLVCYEKSGDFCHRHIVSSWFRHEGFEISEL